MSDKLTIKEQARQLQKEDEDRKEKIRKIQQERADKLRGILEKEEISYTAMNKRLAEHGHVMTVVNTRFYFIGDRKIPTDILVSIIQIINEPKPDPKPQCNYTLADFWIEV